MWKEILKIEPYEMAVAEEFAPKDMKEGRDKRRKIKEGISGELHSFGKTFLNRAMKIDNYVKDEMYGSMSNSDRRVYDMYLKNIRSDVKEKNFAGAKRRIDVLMRQFNLPMDIL